jgi:hypothetical protein
MIAVADDFFHYRVLDCAGMAELIADPQPVDDAREEYEAPELRDLGDLVDVTETGSSTVGVDGTYS